MTFLRRGIAVTLCLAPWLITTPSVADGLPERPVAKRYKEAYRPKPIVRLSAPAPSCRHAHETFGTYDRQNDFNGGFRCATNSTLDKMLANRRDKFAGRGTRYSDGERAANIVADYRVWKNGNIPGPNPPAE